MCECGLRRDVYKTDLRVLTGQSRGNKRTSEYNVNIVARSRNHCCRKKSDKHYIFWACVCSLVLVTERMRRIMSSVASLAPPYFSSLSHKRHDFSENVIEQKMCVLTFSTTLVWSISHFKHNSGRYHKYKNSLHVKYPSSLSNLIKP